MHKHKGSCKLDGFYCIIAQHPLDTAKTATKVCEGSYEVCHGGAASARSPSIPCIANAKVTFPKIHCRQATNST